MAENQVLTPEDKEHFLSHGWVKIPQAFTKEQAAEMTRNVWTRLGMDPDDKSTWHTLRTNMPCHHIFDASKFAPKAWAAICELCGGEDRIHPASKDWPDALIVNLGSAALEGKPDPPQDLQGWHVDGDFFVHYLDSPEQALLVIPLLTDIPLGGGGGGTVLYPSGMRAIARHLHDHPEGVSPRMAPRGHPDFPARRHGKNKEKNKKEKNEGGEEEQQPQQEGEEEEEEEDNLAWFNKIASAGRDEDYVEACGSAGDVYLLHPLMLHSATNNPLRNVRIITNPPVSLREPFCFDRSRREAEEEERGGGEYSLVEKATLRMLGKEEGDGLKDWRITHERERVVPERLRIQEEMKQEELKRLEVEREIALKAVTTAAVA